MAVHIPRKKGGRTRERPDDQTLAELYATHTTAEVAAKYGVSPRTVSNWVASVRQAERKELEAMETGSMEPRRAKAIRIDYQDHLTEIIEVRPEGSPPHYVVVNGAYPGEPKGKGSAQTAATLEEAMEKYRQIFRPQFDKD